MTQRRAALLFGHVILLLFNSNLNFFSFFFGLDLTLCANEVLSFVILVPNGATCQTLSKDLPSFQCLHAMFLLWTSTTNRFKPRIPTRSMPRCQHCLPKKKIFLVSRSFDFKLKKRYQSWWDSLIERSQGVVVIADK